MVCIKNSKVKYRQVFDIITSKVIWYDTITNEVKKHVMLVTPMNSLFFE